MNECCNLQLCNVKMFSPPKSINMDTKTFKANLGAEKGKLKQKFANLTDDDLLLEEGRKEEVEGKNEALFFQNEEELKKFLTSW